VIKEETPPLSVLKKKRGGVASGKKKKGGKERQRSFSLISFRTLEPKKHEDFKSTPGRRGSRKKRKKKEKGDPSPKKGEPREILRS